METRLAQVQTGVLVCILAVLVIIALKPAANPSVAAASTLDDTSSRPMPVRIVNGPPGFGSDTLDVRIIQGTGFQTGDTLKVEVTNPTCGHTNGISSYQTPGQKDDGPCYVTVAR